MRFLHTLVLVVGFAGVAAAQGAPPQPQDAWTGTITSVRHGSTTERLDGGDSLSVTCSENVTFTVLGDGTARFTASHNMTMTISGKGGRATTRQYGSDSGWVYAGVGHDPEFGGAAERLLGMKSRWHFGAGNGAMKIRTITPSAPGFGKLSPDSTTLEFLAGVDLYSDDPTTAKTLTGSRTRQPGDDLGAVTFAHIWPVKMTESLSWSLSRGPLDPTPRVSIRGPDCGCLDPDDPEATPLKFIGTATRHGGEFSEFSVKAEGKMPDIRTNEGGDHAELELVGSKDTGAVTLTLHYTKDGKRYDAKPLRVEFCTIEKIKLDGDEKDLAFDDLDRMKVHAKAKAWLNGQESPSDLEWAIDEIGAPTKREVKPENAHGEEITYTFDGLPEKNSDFGEKKLTAKVSKGPCKCDQEDTVRVFFTGDASGHPGGDGSPNWFYYWKQTSAAPGAAKSLVHFERAVSVENNPTARAIALYEHRTDRILLSPKVFETDACRGEVDRATHQPTGRQAQGIDCYAETVRHEQQHRADSIEWWGSTKGPDGAIDGGSTTDTDGDFLPISLELQLPGCSPISQKSCKDRPFDDVTDAEIRAYWTGWTWPSGSADTEDWVCGKLGKQWQGSKCP